MKKKTEDTVDFDQLVGSEARLYLTTKVQPNTFQLGKVLFEVLEDESDGYRSSMDEVRILSKSEPVPSNRLLATVTITKDSSNGSSVYGLMDNDNHIWLLFGTDHEDSYYPKFVYCWTPKEPKDIKELKKLLKK